MYLKKVRRQYEEFPYPPRNPEDEKKRLIFTVPDNLLRINHFCYGGNQSFEDFRCLVIGGGTGDATIFLAEQLRNFNGEVVHVDLSEKSIEICRQRASVRNLDNITFLRESIFNIDQHDSGLFDYVNCVGVLHHLEDPEGGIKVIRKMLKPDGCAGIMVYANTGRTGVYLIQELMRLLRQSDKNEENKVELTKTIVDRLPETNLFSMLKENNEDYEIYGDSGYYDMFLHSQDKAYRIDEILNLMERNGLHFVDFPEDKKLSYYPEFHMMNDEFLNSLNDLSEFQKYAVAELLSCRIKTHGFYVSLNADTSINLNNVDNIPLMFSHYKKILAGCLSETSRIIEMKTSSGMLLKLKNDRLYREFVNHLNGKFTLREIINSISNREQLLSENVIKRLQPFYNMLININAVVLNERNNDLSFLYKYL